MSATKARIAAAVAVVGGFVVLSGATFLLLHMRGSQAAAAGHHEEPPFKFSHHRVSGENESLSISSLDRTGLADFTSNIPVVVLRSHRPAAVSKSKSYDAFTMEI